jgi:MraZ protein
MVTFIGEYSGKVDAKGRIILPAAFKRQLSAGTQDRFVLKRDIFVKCLILYPIEEWELQVKLIRSKTNPYSQEHNMLLRKFFQGTAEIILDSNNRILIPKRLAEFAEIGREIILAGLPGKIELWAIDKYEEASRIDDDFAEKFERILGRDIQDINEA